MTITDLSGVLTIIATEAVPVGQEFQQHVIYIEQNILHVQSFSAQMWSQRASWTVILSFWPLQNFVKGGEEDTLNRLLSTYQTEASAISKFSTYRLKELCVVIFAPREGMVSGQEQPERAWNG